MTDVLTPSERRRNMRAIRAKDTNPEIVVRRALHRLGYRFRLHADDLPGKPDVVLPKYETVIRVHGCFWHRHHGCRYTTTPRTRPEFWEAKFAGNVARDARTERRLRRGGWRVLTVWECETRRPETLAHRLDRLLQRSRASLQCKA
ncbi:MAG: very short patch repair endonuclease [Phycisphaerales bacterium]